MHICQFPGDSKLSEGRAHMLITLLCILHSFWHVLPILDVQYNYSLIERKNRWRNPKMEMKVFLKGPDKFFVPSR